MKKITAIRKELIVLVFLIITIIFLALMIVLGDDQREELGTEIKEDSLIFGIDVSHYNDLINWPEVKNQKKHKEIEFVIIRATMGASRKDNLFFRNFHEAKRLGFIVGAYHYYDPNENSLLQADNFIKEVGLEVGDIVPILDIERLSSVQDLFKLRLGLKRWLDRVEDYYGVKPMIYTSLSYYQDYLAEYGFHNYPLWIASYTEASWDNQLFQGQQIAIHQFSDQVKIPGIKSWADGNNMLKINSEQIIIKTPT